jgi:hypothetical protein
MAMIVTQTQNMAEDDDSMVEADDTMSVGIDYDKNMSGFGIDCDENMSGVDDLVPCKVKKLVQMTLFGTVVKKLASKSIKVKVRSHLRRKSATTSVKKKVKEQVKCVSKNVSKRKQPKKKKMAPQQTKNRVVVAPQQTQNCVVVNDPGLADTVQLMEQMKFDDMMELRERLFHIQLP